MLHRKYYMNLQSILTIILSIDNKIKNTNENIHQSKMANL